MLEDSETEEIEFASFILREVFASFSVLLTGFYAYTYIRYTSLHMVSFKIFFFLALAEIAKAIVAIMQANSKDQQFCNIVGALETYTQTSCVATLIIMAWSLHMDSIGQEEDFINKLVNLSPLFAFVLFPLPLCLLYAFIPLINK